MTDEPPKHDLATLAFIWKWLPKAAKDNERRLVRIIRNGETLWLRSSELSVADVTTLHALCKAAQIHSEHEAKWRLKQRKQ